MPGCAALNCSNSAKKGFLMKRFPRDPARRKEWLANMKRDNWIPTDFSCLCEIHFTPDMWEKTREDGKRKLKAIAVPTLFPFSQPKQQRKPPAQRKLLPPKEFKPLTGEAMKLAGEVKEDTKVNITIGFLIQPSPLTTNPPATQSSTSQSSSSEHTQSTTSDHTQSTSSEHTQSTSSEHNYCSVAPVEESIQSPQEAELLARLNRYEKMYFKERAKARTYKNMLRNAKSCVKILKLSIQSKITPVLRELFNKDQLMALRRKQSKKSTKFMKWSNETITKALKLKSSCGINGYKELLQQGYPLPSIRTLQRSLNPKMLFPSAL